MRTECRTFQRAGTITSTGPAAISIMPLGILHMSHSSFAADFLCPSPPAADRFVPLSAKTSEYAINDMFTATRPLRRMFSILELVHKSKMIVLKKMVVLQTEPCRRERTDAANVLD